MANIKRDYCIPLKKKQKIVSDLMDKYFLTDDQCNGLYDCFDSIAMVVLSNRPAAKMDEECAGIMDSYKCFAARFVGHKRDAERLWRIGCMSAIERFKNEE